jgi:hypothetical protein
MAPRERTNEQNNHALVTVAALLIAITVTSGKTAEMNSPASQTAAVASESVLWSFGASGDGQFPQAGLLADSWGNFYGTTYGVLIIGKQTRQ